MAMAMDDTSWLVVVVVVEIHGKKGEEEEETWGTSCSLI